MFKHQWDRRKGQGEPSSVPADSMASHCQTGVEPAVAIQPNDKDMTLGASSGWTYRAARKLPRAKRGRKKGDHAEDEETKRREIGWCEREQVFGTHGSPTGPARVVESSGIGTDGRTRCLGEVEIHAALGNSGGSGAEELRLTLCIVWVWTWATHQPGAAASIQFSRQLA